MVKKRSIKYSIKKKLNFKIIFSRGIVAARKKKKINSSHVRLRFLSFTRSRRLPVCFYAALFWIDCFQVKKKNKKIDMCCF